MNFKFYSLFFQKKLTDEEKNYLQAKKQIYPMIELPFIINKLMEIEHLKEIIFSSRTYFPITRAKLPYARGCVLLFKNTPSGV